MADEAFNKTIDKLTSAVSKLSSNNAGRAGSSKNIEKEREAGSEARTQTGYLKQIAKNTAGGGGGSGASGKDGKGSLKGGLLKGIAGIGAASIALAALGGIKKAILGSLGLVAKAGKCVLKKGYSLAKAGLGKIAKGASNLIRGALNSVWKVAAPILKPIGSFLKNIATTAGGAIKGGLTKAFDATKMAGKWGLAKLVNLKNIATSGARSVAGAIQGAMSGITGVAKKGGKGAAKLGKLMLRGAKFIPGAGLAVAGAIALYDGLSAGMEEFKKSGDLGKSIKEGTAGALSGITFGLVSQKTFSDAFTTVGEKFTTLTKGVSDAASKAWVGAKALIPTEEGLKKSFTKLSANLAPLKNLSIPKDISFAAVATAFTGNAVAINDSFANFTGIDVSKTIGKLGDKVAKQATALKNSFENITGMTIPKFDDVKKGLSNLSVNLKEKFKVITGIEIPSLDDIGKRIQNILPSLGNPIRKMAEGLEGTLNLNDISSWLPNISFGDKLATALNAIAGKEMGGPIKSGNPYWVGEAGPELVVPNASGTVIPNHKIGGGGDAKMTKILESLSNQLANGGTKVDASSINVSSAPSTTIGGSNAPRQRVVVYG